MPNVANPTNLKKATQHLSANDRVMARLIKAFGPCDIKPHTNYYQELVDSIIGQQLSVKAAATIRKRFYALFGKDKLPNPEQIISKSVEDIRTAGLSNAKANYVQDLARHILDGRLEFDSIDIMSNEEVAAKLIAVKGIGEWTAHMFMMFAMGRLDILPVGDLGIKNGMMKLYNLKTQPTADDIRNLATKNSWHPYESVASWYVWQSLDNTPK